MNLDQANDCLNAIQLLANRGVLSPEATMTALQALIQRAGDCITYDAEGVEAKAELLKAIHIAQSVFA